MTASTPPFQPMCACGRIGCDLANPEPDGYLWGANGRGAWVSDDGLYRYWLTRNWRHDPRSPRLTFVMLNPSTADHREDDPTIRRCVSFAKREGYAGIMVWNLYALRSTEPKALWSAADPVGPWNDDNLAAHLDEQVERGVPVVAAWGANARLPRVAEVLNLVPGVDWRCLGTTKQGAPKHPLYIKGDQPLMPYPWSALTAQSAQHRKDADA